MRYILLPFLFALIQVYPCFAKNDIATKVILIGNAGTVNPNDGYLTAIKNSISFDSNTVVLFLGNNISAPGDTASLRAEADVVRNTPAKAYFIPGYTDWDKGKELGYKSVLQEQAFIESLGNKNIKLYPADGCPGPKKLNIGNDVTLVILNSQWWLHEYTKPDIESSCGDRTFNEVLADLEDVIDDERDNLVLFTTYHPFYNKGIHSGTFGLKQHVFPFTDINKLKSFYFPLPVAGSLYPLTRNALTTKQDLNNKDYNAMIAPIQRVVNGHPNLIHISGQEHNMQLLENEGVYHIISGAASTPSRVRHTGEVKFAEQAIGFTVLEISHDKKVTANFYEVSGTQVKQVYSGQLLDFSKKNKIAPDTAKMPYVSSDSVVASANKTYQQTSGFNHFFAGNNYRKIWGADVKMKVFHVNEEKGGLKVKGLGGGHQSKSLQLEDRNGKKWVLRSVNKSLDEVLPEGFKETIATDLAQDMISASHPYGALVVPDLLAPLGIVHATPEIVFVPNDTLLGKYRPIFANTVALLEEREPSLYGEKTLNSIDAIHKIVDKNDHFSENDKYLQARMVDFLIADFDRHYAQWKWGVADTGKGKLYYPIPKDRDQALFYSDGLLIKIARKRALFYMQGFEPRVRHLRSMAWASRDIDMFFLSGLGKDDWRKNIDTFQHALSDSVIATAVSKLPPEIYAMQGPQVKSTLITRRDIIADKGMDYYRFLAKKVNVLGSNRDDIFKVSGENGGLWVKVYSKDKDGDTNLRYFRWFDPVDTREIRLYGFNGSDYFDMTQDTRYKIRMRVVGGSGNDTFDLRGGYRNFIYDLKTEDNQVIASRHTVNMFSNNATVNEYRFRDKVYNSLYFPIITLGLNADDGLLAGLGVMRTTYGFRQDSFATQQKLTGLASISRRAYQLKYRGEFIDVFRHYDITARAQLYNPTLNYFFGFGNESVNDQTKPIEYYRTRYDYASTDLLLRKRFLNFTTMSASLGPSFYYYWNDHSHNKGRVLETPSVVGLDSGVYESKMYGGGKFVLNIDNINNDFFPTQGVEWNTEFSVLKPFNVNTPTFSKLESELELYATLDHPSNLVALIKLGGGHIFSDQFEYFQALGLGANNYLRGFRWNRFTGASMAHGSGELRLKLFDFNAHVVKGDFGVLGFEELGRVWMRNERSDTWHNSYGGGIYFTPFNMFILSGAVAFSDEDTLFSISLGTRFNVTFQGNN